MLGVSYLRSKWMLNAWANDKHYEIGESKWCWFQRGPYQETWLSHQTVFRVRVRDRSGGERSCWAKLGGFFLGLWADDVWITWDDTSPQREYPQFVIPLVLAGVVVVPFLIAIVLGWR